MSLNRSTHSPIPPRRAGVYLAALWRARRPRFRGQGGAAPLQRGMRQSRAGSGEPLVWVTAMGLTMGLVMIVYLLGLIVVNGHKAFWPRRIVQVSLRPESQARLHDAPILAGEIVKRQQPSDIPPTGRPPSPQAPPHADASARRPYLLRSEWQLFLGNKDVYGLGFRYVDTQDMVDVSYPMEIALIERLEYGDAIGTPVSLEIKSAGILSATDAQFKPRLQALVQEVNQRWGVIRRLEKNDIGAISARMHTLRLRSRVLARSEPATDAAKAQAQALLEDMQALQATYEGLAKEARDLRDKQTENVLTYRLPTGQEQRLPLGQVVHVMYANQLTWLQRVAVLLRNIWVFLTDEPREANTEGGVFPAIFGTCVMTVLMSIAVMPFGVMAAVYLREYARQGLVVRCVRIAVNNLAGVPSIVFGVFGLGFFVYLVGGSIDELLFSSALPTPTFGTGGILWASLTLALMTVPVVIVSTEEALAAVPRGMREGSLACGASKWQTIQRLVLPAAAPGILTGLILAMARGAGEVAPLMLVGVVKLAPSLAIDQVFPFLHLERKFMHLGFHIFDLGFQSPDSEAARPMVFATTLLLITLVVCLNLGAIYLREKLRRKYATGAF